MPSSFMVVFERNNAVIEWQLVSVYLGCPVPRAFGAVLIDDIGHALSGQRLRRSGDFEMQMRLAGVPGSANGGQQLPSPNAVPCLHPQASRLQMEVIREWPLRSSVIVFPATVSNVMGMAGWKASPCPGTFRGRPSLAATTRPSATASTGGLL